MFVFDGEKRRIYEAPQGSTFITLPSGVRRYYFTNPTDAPIKTKYDVKKDLWSRSQDYLLNSPWSTIPFEALGGAIRGEDDNGTVYQSADFKLNAKEGWRIVLGDWKHEALFNGNLYSNSDDELFDLSSITTVGSYPRINGAADLLTYISKADSASLEQIEALLLKHKGDNNQKPCFSVIETFTSFSINEESNTMLISEDSVTFQDETKLDMYVNNGVIDYVIT